MELLTFVSILTGLIGINLMIFIHEAGHYIMAKICRIDVDALALGFGPIIKSWKREGKTEFRICAIPLGGYCRLKGQQDLERAIARKDSTFSLAEDKSLFSAHPWKRLLIYIAGPFFNILFAIFCYTTLLTLPVPSNITPPRIVLANDYKELFPDKYPSTKLITGDVIFSVNGEKVETYIELSSKLSELAKMDEYCVFETDRGSFSMKPLNGKFGILPFTPTKVSNITPSSAEANAGLMKGDIIFKANDKEISNMFDLLSLPLGWTTFSVLRRNNIEQISFFHSETNFEFSLYTPFEFKKEFSFSQALNRALTHFIVIFSTTLDSLENMFRGSAKISSTVSGTWQASQSIGFMATEGFESNSYSGIRIVLYLLGCLSISLAIANLIPIPSLDGGLILLSLLEIIFRRTFPPKFHLILQLIGWSLIIVIVTLLFVAGCLHLNI